MKRLLLLMLIPFAFACSKTDCVDLSCIGSDGFVCEKGLWESVKNDCKNTTNYPDCVCDQFN